MTPTFSGTFLTGIHTVVFHTSLGSITIELNADKAPKTVTNFVELTRDGYYDNQLFHRVIAEFMVQGGDPTATGTGGESIYGADFEDEPNDIALERGVIAMANCGPNTNGSQFFFIQVHAGTPWLQGKHTGFGSITKGLEVLDAIIAKPTDPMDKPIEDITYTVEVV